MDVVYDVQVAVTVVVAVVVVVVVAAVVVVAVVVVVVAAAAAVFVVEKALFVHLVYVKFYICRSCFPLVVVDNFGVDYLLENTCSVAVADAAGAVDGDGDVGYVDVVADVEYFASFVAVHNYLAAFEDFVEFGY
ncbi:unnamed protein product [[Candida] boidinii]|uniref:Unnamed protein product n=1 Tax=Candida boidinii TaxID=5477 RepID=A0A9W6WKZ1_CANBO|nr:unnamed protein product [[Candida] boidinii]GMG39207.1 unnamed protein product [[Candida] boidinii]